MDIEPRVATIFLFLILTVTQEVLFLRQKIYCDRLKRVTILGAQDKFGPIFLFVFYFVIWLGTIYSLFVNEPIIFFHIAGFLFVGTGIAIRIKALHDLGCNYAHAIKIYENHKLVTRGIYNLIRHPLSFGLAIELLGMASIARIAWVWIVWSGLITILIRRTKLEDKILVQIFGDEAKKYQDMVPSINILSRIFKKRF